MEIMNIIAELEKCGACIGEEKLEQFINMVNAHQRIFVYGTGRSGLMLKALAMRLMQMGYQAYVVGETTTPSVGKGDLLIVASASGETKSVCSAADDGAAQGTDILVITGSNDSTLSKGHMPLIRIQSDSKFSEEKISVQPLGSLFEQMLLMIFDAVILKMTMQQAEANSKMAHRHASIE